MILPWTSTVDPVGAVLLASGPVSSMLTNLPEQVTLDPDSLGAEVVAEAEPLRADNPSVVTARSSRIRTVCFMITPYVLLGLVLAAEQANRD
jgi:hypothetical protein